MFKYLKSVFNRNNIGSAVFGFLLSCALLPMMSSWSIEAKIMYGLFLLSFLFNLVQKGMLDQNVVSESLKFVKFLDDKMKFIIKSNINLEYDTVVDIYYEDNEVMRYLFSGIVFNIQGKHDIIQLKTIQKVNYNLSSSDLAIIDKMFKNDKFVLLNIIVKIQYKKFEQEDFDKWK